MQLSTQEMDGGITRVELDGRMDIAGAAAVDLKMNLIAGSAKKLLIDLQKVSFLGSMGLRSIVLPARAVLSKGGKVVIFAPTEMVESVLKASNIDSLLPDSPRSGCGNGSTAMNATILLTETMHAEDTVKPESRLTLKSQLDDMAALWTWVEAIVAEYAIPPDTAFAIHLCLEEAISNVIRHGYSGQPGHLTHRRLRLAKRARTRLHHRGSGSALRSPRILR